MKGRHVDSRYPLAIIIQKHSLSCYNVPSLVFGSLFPVVFVIIQRWSSSIFPVLDKSRMVSNIVPSKCLSNGYYFISTSVNFNIICPPFLFQLQPTFHYSIGYYLVSFFFRFFLDHLATTSFEKSLKGLSGI